MENTEAWRNMDKCRQVWPTSLPFSPDLQASTTWKYLWGWMCLCWKFCRDRNIQTLEIISHVQSLSLCLLVTVNTMWFLSRDENLPTGVQHLLFDKCNVLHSFLISFWENKTCIMCTSLHFFLHLLSNLYCTSGQSPLIRCMYAMPPKKGDYLSLP